MGPSKRKRNQKGGGKSSISWQDIPGCLFLLAIVALSIDTTPEIKNSSSSSSSSSSKSASASNKHPDAKLVAGEGTDCFPKQNDCHTCNDARTMCTFCEPAAFLHEGQCFKQTESQWSGTGLVGTGGPPVDVRVSGVDSDCYDGWLNSVYAYQGNTADGKHYYAHDTKTVYGTAYLYYDKDCNGPGNTADAALKGGWFIDRQMPSTTATSDLDHDGICDFYAHTLHAASATSRTPPTTTPTAWRMFCDGKFVDMTLTITPLCTTPLNYVYAYPSTFAAVDAGCGDGVARQRTEVESCNAPDGCGCEANSRREVETETEYQVACCGNGGPADVRVSGVDIDCYNGWLNGDYAYQGNTADGKHYYAYDTKTSVGVAYLYYDKDPDGPRSTKCEYLFAHAAGLFGGSLVAHHWPHTTKRHQLLTHLLFRVF